MALQNRLVLDQLTAASGGVCVLVGKHCCTFIPAEDGDGGSITQALANLTALTDMMRNDHAVPDGDWLAWLTGPGWYSLLARLLTPVAIAVAVFLLIFLCIIPCIRSLLVKIVGRLVTSFVQVGKPGEAYTRPDAETRSQDSSEEAETEFHGEDWGEDMSADSASAF